MPDPRIRFVVVAGVEALVAAAIVQELRRPSDERRWHGRVVGVPYDFRRPTWARLRDRWWSPEDPRLFVDRAFGLGWDINLARLVGRRTA